MVDQRTRRLGTPDAEREPRRLQPGDVVDDWIVLRPLGGGGFGAVYEARHRTTGQRVALKLLHAHLAAAPDIVARFRREAEVIDRLRHPGVVELIAVGVAGGRPYLCMELLDGEDLAARVRRAGPMSGAQALAVLEPVCSALAAAHELGIVHRDVKASNVMVCGGEQRGAGGEQRIVLLDFGIAKLSDALAGDLTASHQSLGTPSCMAPEQVDGRAVDARCDVYGLGALAFFLLTGRMPFEDPSLTMTQYLHLHARRPRVSASAPVPPRVDDVVARAMAIQPAERFSDPLSLLAAFRAALRDSALLAAVEVDAAAAILVTVRDAGTGLDEALLTDLEAVLPAAERALAAAGFALALDLGSSAVFAHPACDADHAVATALAVWDELARRRHRDPRVRIGICVHRAPATFHGAEIRSGTLLRPASWGIPDELEGMWATAAVRPGATAPIRLR
ncbi:MAG TPA: serine/threonine-protein kinase [Kofleriaceae bacterium]|jgi:serine/threonine-protein kinase|nr:serine/threonine-protein kinase [Kofleriaceae bacterium]